VKEGHGKSQEGTIVKEQIYLGKCKFSLESLQNRPGEEWSKSEAAGL